MTDDGWVPEARPVPEALTDTFPPERDPFLVPVLEKLDQASLEVLSVVLGGWPIVPSEDA